MSDNDSSTKPKENNLRDRPFLIGISGGSGSGKTSVANILYHCLGKMNCLLFSMDTYYKNLTPEQEKDLSNYNFDTPDALDLDLLSDHLYSLRHWKEIEMPTYDFSTNKRKEETLLIKPNKFIIFEGILAFHDKRMRDLMDLKLFIDLEDDIRLSRRIYRDIIFRGRKMADVLDRYHKFVKPAFNTYIKPTKAFADIIIPRGGSNTIAIDIINYYLRHKLLKIFPESFQNFTINLKNKKAETEDLVINKLELDELLKKEHIQKIEFKNIFDDNLGIIGEKEKKLYLTMLKNYLSGEKYQYFDLYLDIFTKKIFQQIENDNIIYKNHDIEKIKELIKSRIGKNDKIKIFVYFPILFEVSEKQKKIFDYLSKIKEIDSIKILSIFLKKEVIQHITNITNITFSSIYCGESIDNYQNFIKRGGYFGNIEGEYTNSNLIVFSESNFEERLAQLHEVNKNSKE